jgi:hypothetical protein
MPSRRVLLPLLGIAVLAGAALVHAGEKAEPPPVYGSQLEAFEDACVRPASHGGIIRTVRATRWERLEGDAVPAVVRGNGAVRYAEVRRGEVAGAPVILAIGEFSGTSFCRVYFRATHTAAIGGRLRKMNVLGAPLGEPDFDDKLVSPANWRAIGWHKSANGQWRALHYSFDATGQGPDAAWQSIEITRKA